MRIFKSPTGDTFGYTTDGEQDDLIAEAIAAGWAELTEEQKSAIAAPSTDPVILAKKMQAAAALAASDRTYLRCLENGVTFPQEWKDYRTELRAVVRTGTGDLPTQPSYPSGS